MKLHSTLPVNAVRLALAAPVILVTLLDALGYLKNGDFLDRAPILMLVTVIIAIIIAAVTTRKREKNYRLGIGLGLLGAFLMVWVNGAGGIIGSEGNPINRIYYGVVAIGFIWAVIEGFQTYGMARAMFAVTAVQAVIGIVVTVMEAMNRSSVFVLIEILALNGMFTVLFAGSALLFRKAALEQK